MNLPIDISHVVLETPRLILRAWQASDLDDFFEYARVEGVGECAGWPHHESKDTTKMVLNSFIEHKKVLALVDKENQKVIGSLGLEEYNPEEVDASFTDLKCREMGYVLSKDYWGKGIMCEAVNEVIRYCFEDLGMDALFCAHFKRNHQSQRVIEKCHFQFYGDILYKSRMGIVEETKLYVLYHPNKNKEIDEAIDAIEDTLSHLEKANEYLHHASNWGFFDMFGGGFFTTMIKHEQMDEAKKALENAQQSVIKLKKELLDVSPYLNIDLNIEAFLGFADYFFDGFFVDSMVQSKLNQAKNQVKEAISKLNQLEMLLKERR